MSDGSDGIRVAAPAKLNLYLRVQGRRTDGYHEIETLFQAVDLSDTVEVARISRGIELDVHGAEVGPQTANLAWRAAQAYLDDTGLGIGVRIRLEKRIPAGAGLGGGSSDAAAVLRALERLAGDSGLGASVLPRLGAELGSDVPFFLGTSTLAVGRGRGERLEAQNPLPPAGVVLVLPPVHVGTGDAYRALADHRRAGGRVLPGEGGGRTEGWPTTWEAVAARARNDFEPVIAALHPQIGRSLEALRETGAAPVMLSGSGAACFGVLPDPAAAERAAREVGARLGWTAVATRTLPRFPDPADLGRGAG